MEAVTMCFMPCLFCKATDIRAPQLAACEVSLDGARGQPPDDAGSCTFSTVTQSAEVPDDNLPVKVAALPPAGPSSRQPSLSKGAAWIFGVGIMSGIADIMRELLALAAADDDAALAKQQSTVQTSEHNVLLERVPTSVVQASGDRVREVHPEKWSSRESVSSWRPLATYQVFTVGVSLLAVCTPVLNP